MSVPHADKVLLSRMTFVSQDVLLTVYHVPMLTPAHSVFQVILFSPKAAPKLSVHHASQAAEPVQRVNLPTVYHVVTDSISVAPPVLPVLATVGLARLWDVLPAWMDTS